MMRSRGGGGDRNDEGKTMVRGGDRDDEGKGRGRKSR